MARLAAALPLLAFAIAVDAAPPIVPATKAGRVEGVVTVGRQLTARRVRFNLYPDAARTAPRSDPSSPTEELGNVVVYLESAAAPANRQPLAPAAMAQRELTFEPHVLAVAKGTTVEFPNRDMVFHNVFSLSKAASFDLGRYPSGSSKEVRFDKPGLVKVFCHIHSDMSAIILVLDDPFFTSPESDGRFAIDGIPPGEYRVVAWHERAKPAAKTIRIEAGRAEVVNFNIPLAETSDGG